MKGNRGKRSRSRFSAHLLGRRSRHKRRIGGFKQCQRNFQIIIFRRFFSMFENAGNPWGSSKMIRCMRSHAGRRRRRTRHGVASTTGLVLCNIIIQVFNAARCLKKGRRSPSKLRSTVIASHRHLRSSRSDLRINESLLLLTIIVQTLKLTQRSLLLLLLFALLLFLAMSRKLEGSLLGSPSASIG